jgi:hypothetical protein
VRPLRHFTTGLTRRGGTPPLQNSANGAGSSGAGRLPSSASVPLQGGTPGERGASATILHLGGAPVPTVPAARAHEVKRPGASPLPNAAGTAGRPGPPPTLGARARWQSVGVPAAGSAAGQREGAAGGVAAAPVGGGQPALEVLARRRQQALGVHLRQAAQADLPQAVPLLGLPEERLDPDRLCGFGTSALPPVHGHRGPSRPAPSGALRPRRGRAGCAGLGRAPPGS